MPSRALSRKRRRRRKRARNRPVQTLKLYKVLRYSDNSQSISSFAGNVAVVVFSANNCFDPEVALGGHQPRGFDQYMALYDHFVVVGSKIKVWIQADSAASRPAIAGITVRDTANILSSPNAYLESPNTITKSLADIGGSSNRLLTMKVNPNRFLGIPKPLSEDKVEGSATAGPTDQVFYHLWLYDSAGQISSDFNYSYQIDYATVFKEPKLPPVS